VIVILRDIAHGGALMDRRRAEFVGNGVNDLADAAWEAGNACIDCHGGYGYAEEYDVERKFRECRLYKTAPVNNNLVLAFVGEHVLGMPRSY
jgi:alkylation response protein AidB-like acyl-CoA dehydrogenase